MVTPIEFDSGMKLDEVHDVFHQMLHSRDGFICPVCERFTKMYRRSMNSGIAINLIKLYKRTGMEEAHVPSVLPMRSSTTVTVAKHWGLIHPAITDEGPGWWAITNRGRDWIEREIRIPRYALLYNDVCFGLEGPKWAIQKALGEKFDYDDLMRA